MDSQIIIALGGLFAAGITTATILIQGHNTRLKKRIEKEEKESLGYLFRFEFEIHQLLTDLRSVTQADRSYLIQFHNGVTTAAKLHIMKMSISNEVVSEGTSREADRTKDLPIAFYLNFIDELMQKEFIIFDDVESLDRSTFKEFLLDKGILSFACKLIKKFDNKEIGIVCIDYTDLKNISSHQDIIKSLRKYSDRIAFKLSSL